MLSSDASMAPDVDIRQMTALTSEERDRLYGWSDNVFGTAGMNITYRPKDNVLRFLLYADGQGPLSHAAVLQHHATANGRPVLIGGIGGVVTIPPAQRRGYAGRVVRHATDFLRSEWRTDFALLFCTDRIVSYYQRLGWTRAACEVLVDQPGGKIPSPFHVMTVAFKPEFETIESIDLGSAPW